MIILYYMYALMLFVQYCIAVFVTCWTIYKYTHDSEALNKRC